MLYGSVYDNDEGDWDHNRQEYRSGRKYGKPMGPEAPHLPNKMERKELARIMQKSGLSEAEVREDLTHRRSLAKASKSRPEGVDRYELAKKRALRKKAKDLDCEVWELDMNGDDQNFWRRRA